LLGSLKPSRYLVVFGKVWLVWYTSRIWFSVVLSRCSMLHCAAAARA